LTHLFEALNVLVSFFAKKEEQALQEFSYWTTILEGRQREVALGLFACELLQHLSSQVEIDEELVRRFKITSLKGLKRLADTALCVRLSLLRRLFLVHNANYYTLWSQRLMDGPTLPTARLHDLAQVFMSFKTGFDWTQLVIEGTASSGPLLEAGFTLEHLER
jgi:hypothetical protein